MVVTFARQTSYTIQVVETSRKRGLFFTVTLEVLAPLDLVTGMSAHLPRVEQALALVFCDKTLSSFDIEQELRSAYQALQRELPQDHAILGVTLSEARGWGAGLLKSELVYHRKWYGDIEGQVYGFTAFAKTEQINDEIIDRFSLDNVHSLMKQYDLVRLKLEELGRNRVYEWGRSDEQI